MNKNTAQAFMSEDEAVEALTRELSLQGLSVPDKKAVIYGFAEVIMEEAMVAIFSHIPESEYPKIEKLIESEQQEAAQELIMKHVPNTAEIIEGVFKEGAQRYRQHVLQSQKT
ncbi:MAG: hypothetical protein RI911_540 [Candidatus Parcubacteria bacterium]|jgi:hypothetical protein